MKNTSPFSQYDKRLFLCCGLTRDRFCLPDCSRVRFDEFLHRHLKMLGYERILFYSHQGLYFFDKFSYHATMFGKEHRPAKAPAQRTVKLAAAPGGLRLRRKKVPKTNAGLSNFSAKPDKWRYPDYPFTEIITLLERVIKMENPRTAFVFYTDHLDGFSDRPAVTQQFRGMLEADFRSLPPSNRNLILFVFGLGVDELVTYLRGKPWNFLMGLERNVQGAGLARIVQVGPPEKDEVLRLVHHYRLTRGIEIEWQHLPLIINAVTAHLKSNAEPLTVLEKWLEECAETAVKTLSTQTIRQFLGQPINEKPASERLDSLIGLQNIKKMVARQIRFYNEFKKFQPATESALSGECRIDRLSTTRCHRPLPPEFNLHLALKGNPGTGKTTVAKLLGEIYREAGILELGHTIKVTRKDLVAGFVGQTALKTREKIEQAMGGVLFIDEAYSLVQGGENGFGNEALTEILEAMSDLKGQFAVIAAGYPDEIDTLIHANPGFRRRFDAIVEIDDFKPHELEAIFRNTCQAYTPPVRLAPELDIALPGFFECLYRNRDKNFGNAGTVKDEIFTEIVKSVPLDKTGKRVIRQKDFPEAHQPYFKKAGLTPAPLEELEEMIGLEGVKNRVRELLLEKDIRSQRNRALGRKDDSSVPTPGHYIFSGNPGTGKTTVARLMAKQLNLLGLLKTDRLIPVSASELIGAYMGHTEERTRKFLKNGLDGVCFIDEAHQLASGGETGYGKQALGVIVPFMENHNENFTLIFAGYPDEMETLLQTDPGFRSRFEPPIIFDDYTPQELVRIFNLMAKKEHLVITDNAQNQLAVLFHTIYQHRTANFGNARTVRQILKLTNARQALRLKETGNHPAESELFAIRENDIPPFENLKTMI